MNEMNAQLKFAPYKIFEENDMKYLYTVNKGQIFNIDEMTLDILKYDGKYQNDLIENLSLHYDKNVLDCVLADMKGSGFINYDLDTVSESTELIGDVRFLTLLVIQDCNLRCSYCYGDEGNYSNNGVMTLEIAKKSIDFLVNKAKSNRLSICFFGGEPLLKFDLIKDIVQYCKEISTKTDKKFGLV